LYKNIKLSFDEDLKKTGFRKKYTMSYIEGLSLAGIRVNMNITLFHMNIKVSKHDFGEMIK
jgi:hypothetical protein